MKHALILTTAGALILGLQIDRPAAQPDNQSLARKATPNGPLNLSETDRAAVIRAALDAKSHQTTPKEFTPAVGAPVPREVFQHGFRPDVVSNIPILKHYWYAYLDREIVLIDSLQKKVVAVIPLPAEYVSGEQPHQGAAEAASESNEHGANSTSSVPAYTSPESIR